MPNQSQVEIVTDLWRRRHDLAEAEWLEAAPVLLCFCAAALNPSPLSSETQVEAAVEAALHAIVPGGAAVWCFLPQKDAWTPHETARDVMRVAILAALNTISSKD